MWVSGFGVEGAEVGGAATEVEVGLVLAETRRCFPLCWALQSVKSLVVFAWLYFSLCLQAAASGQFRHFSHESSKSHLQDPK